MPDIQNPQHEPGNEKRLMLVFLLTFIVMLAFQPFFKKYLPQPVTPPPQQNQPVQAQRPTTAATTTAPSVAPLTGSTMKAASSPSAASIAFSNSAAYSCPQLRQPSLQLKAQR